MACPGGLSKAVLMKITWNWRFVAGTLNFRPPVSSAGLALGFEVSYAAYEHGPD